MLVSLGFFLACMLAMALAPAYRRRSDRLAAERVRRALPISLAEIRADKDRLRAQHAVETHRLELQVEEARLNAARQKIELNRRDARISALDEEVRRLGSGLEENVNARRVLEHNISERLPHVMSRLDEAHRLLEQRDQQIETLNAGAQKGIRALDEAMMLNAQQRSEIERLRTTMATRGGRFAGEGAHGDSQAALNSELEALRSRTRTQAGVIAKLQELLSKYGADATGTVAEASGEALQADGPDTDMDRLRRDLNEARATLQLARIDANEIAAGAPLASSGELQALKTRVEEQATEIKRLRAALETYQSEDGAADAQKATAARTSRIAAKARLNALLAQVESQDEIIKRLRTELAQNNERLAHQAAQFRDEMRRIGAGTRPTTADIRRAQKPSKRSLVERVTQPRSADIVALPGAALIAAQARSEPAENVVHETKAADEVREPASRATPVEKAKAPQPAPVAEGKSTARDAGDDADASGAKPVEDKADGAPKRRGRLMDRIAGLSRKEA
jgi:chromosome segregation ATPase